MTQTFEQFGYETIKQMAAARRRSIPELLALSRNNDPFFAGSPAQRAKAEWFVATLAELGLTTRFHLRRVHYKLVSQHDPKRHDGKPYENTEACWAYLGDGSKVARYLGLVPPDAFDDRRNPPPLIFGADGEPLDDPSWDLDLSKLRWQLPAITADLAGQCAFYLPDVSVSGYEYSPVCQPYHLELWIEKSTMDDVLLPICRQLGINLVRGVGFQSITSAVNLLQRVEHVRRVAHDGKPARVFYLSDFDPAGDEMAAAVARQLEFWLPRYAAGADLKLTPLVLTKEQAAEYDLPRTPIKDSDKRKASFETLHGQGAVEVDALEALHPGELAQIVRRAVQPYRDPSLEERMAEARGEAEDAARQAWEDATAAQREELAAIEEEVRAIASEYQGRLDEMGAELKARLAPLAERLESVQRAVPDATDTLRIELPVCPEPVTETADESEWLFNSARDYLNQLAFYKARKQVENLSAVCEMTGTNHL
jgi:hypothetical protein